MRRRTGRTASARGAGAGADPGEARGALPPARRERPAGRAPSSRTPRSCPASRHGGHESRERAGRSPAVASALYAAPRERLGGRDYIALARQEGRGDHGALAEARRESVDHPREPLAAHGVGIEEPELAHSRGSETPGRDADEAHRARHPLALQESARPAVELEPVLRRRPGSAPGVRLEGRQPELERDARRREAPFPQLGGDPLCLGSKRRPEEVGVRRVSAEGFFGTDRFRKTEGLDRSGVTTEGEVVQVLAVLPEASGQHGARDTLEPADRGEAELSEGLRRHTPDTPDQLDRERGPLGSGPMVVRPSSRRACAVTRPTPQISSPGGGARKRAPPPAATATRPSGFSSSEATFATNLFDARPAEAVRHVSSRIRRLIARTASSALPKSPSVPVRSTNASSTDTGSTSGEKSASMPMTCTETARYFAMSTGRKAAWAQSLAAREIGIAERTPNRRASYDAAETTPRPFGCARR